MGRAEQKTLRAGPEISARFTSLAIKPIKDFVNANYAILSNLNNKLSIMTYSLNGRVLQLLYNKTC